MTDDGILLIIGALFVLLFIGDPDIYDRMVAAWDSYFTGLKS